MGTGIYIVHLVVLQMEYDVAKREIRADKVRNDLDSLSVRFLSIVEKYVDYVIISGYVSILLGRSRATEDVDLFVKPLSKESFFALYDELKDNGFWCLNAEESNEVYDYLLKSTAIRFAEIGKSVPNFEMKFPKDSLDEESFDTFIMVILPYGKIKISSLERQIAFKRYFLKSDKDNEDALFLEEKFKNLIDFKKVDTYRELIRVKRGSI